MSKRGIEAVGRQYLEAFDPVGGGFQCTQHEQRVIGTGEAEPGDGALVDCRNEHQPDRGDDPQCPLRAGQQLVEAGAAIVLLEAGQSVMDGAIGKHRFKPLDQPAHRAEAKHLRAAGIGRMRPRWSPLPPRSTRQREALAGVGGGLVQGFEDHPGLGHGMTGSRARMWFIRASERYSAEPSAGGVAPPTIELLPPWGTSAT